jgi:hypothetical protein
MAPLDQYLMADRKAEIALARTAAPPSISSDATVMGLGRHGYETAVEVKNGFVCIVERAWIGPFEKDPGFWNPKNRGPDCYNPEGCQDGAAVRFDKDKLVLGGAGAPDSPVMVNPHVNGAPEPVTEFMISVSEWSDVTPADTEGH